MLACEILVTLLITLFCYKAKYSNGCETQTSVFINRY